MKAIGYSQTPLAKKLGIKEGTVMTIVNAPDYYFSLFTDFPAHVEILNDAGKKKDLVHLFCRSAVEVDQLLFILKNQITPNGMIWVSWPKKASKVETDITEDIVRSLAFQMGLVDIKVCAVDHVWSGLKLVIPVKARKVSSNV